MAHEPAVSRSERHKSFVLDMCDREGHTLLRAEGMWKCTTKPDLVCKEQHVWNTTTVTGLKSGKRCPTCAKLNPARTGGRKGLGLGEWVKLAEEKSKSTGVKFLGVVGEWTNANGKVRLECEKHGVWESSSMSGFVSSTHGNCNACGRERELASRNKSDEYYITKVIDTGNIDDRLILCSGGSRGVWYVKCRICSNDTLCSKRLCSGIFESTFENLKNGHLPCRCSIVRGLSEEQTILYVNSIIGDKRYECVGVSKDNKRLQMFCKDHGYWNPVKNAVITRRTGCPGCAATGYDPTKDAVFYVLLISNGVEKFVGYGISNSFKNRFKIHRTNLHSQGFYVEECTTFKGDGAKILDFEKFVKETLSQYKTEITGFKTEATHFWNKALLESMASDKLCDTT